MPDTLPAFEVRGVQLRVDLGEQAFEASASPMFVDALTVDLLAVNVG